MIYADMKICVLCGDRLPTIQFVGDRDKCRKCDWLEKEKEAKKLGIEFNVKVFRKMSAEERRQVNRIKNKKSWSSYVSKYRKERSKRDPNFKLLCTLRSRLCSVIRRKGIGKLYHAKELVGCSIEDLKAHIESKFKPGMTWENHGQWHIDHIEPIASFDLTDPAQQRECFHYTNLQPLWAKENLSKGGRTRRVS